MESKILNFPDAMKLAQIVTKYLDTESIKNITVLDFIEKIIEKMKPIEYLQCLEILLGEKIEKDVAGADLLSLFSSGIMKNNILLLLDTYHNLGFT